ncbi:histone-like nucleoid-structuring protein Lsr2 [Actinomadura mexicana]|uniref:Lsr2 protein n=1 Tax=Actinomadura mexicana TaxID=134959 RepID=A0A239EFG2_9ACTN|nr:Lsr2 family protein [Actinomadura mexicana]SNS42753.1 Lsr2 protein [Actinomadura mexicana]
MAQQVKIRLVDDISGGEAVETVSFSLDGRAYEIDLNKKNAAKLRKVIEPYREHGRKARRVAARSAARTAGSRERSAEIRRWARSAGIPVNDRGRIPADVIQKFEAAH